LKETADTTVDHRRLVREGYDRCAEAYAAARRDDDSEQLSALLHLLSDGSKVLDLGCGAGVPIARALARRHRVTGVDVSERMLGLARASVPDARYVLGDIAEVGFAECSFDAVVAIFVLFHLPVEEQITVLQKVWSWLRPGGYLLATLSEEEEDPYTEDDFFGTRMYWSSLAYEDYERFLQGLGYDILGKRIIGHGYGRAGGARDERHPMVLAQRPPE